MKAHVFNDIREVILPANPWWANQFHRTYQMRKWVQTCLIQRVKVSRHRDWGDNKHALSSCMTTPSVRQCAGAQPAVISFLTKLLIVWMLPSCSDTLFSCSLICLFHKCFWHTRKRSTGLRACAKSILKVCCRRGKSSSARNILFRRGEQHDAQHTQTHAELKVTALPWWKKKRNPFSLSLKGEKTAEGCLGCVLLLWLTPVRLKWFTLFISTNQVLARNFYNASKTGKAHKVFIKKR